MKSKGLTIIELLVSIVLLSVVMIFIFALLIDIRQEEQRSNFSSADLLNRSIIMENIQNILLEKGLTDIDFQYDKDNEIQTFTFHHKVDSTTLTVSQQEGKINILTIDSTENTEAWIIESAEYNLDATCYTYQKKGDKELITIKIFPNIAGTSLEDNVLLDIEIFHIDSNPETLPTVLGELNTCQVKSDTP